jgi:predicted dienelactone hydrolase
MKRVVRAVSVAVMVGLAGVAALLGSLWVERGIEVTLPTPTGPLAVGRTTYAWADAATSNTLAPVPGAKRELLVWIWYPSMAAPSIAKDDYIPAHMRTAAGPSHGPMKLVTRELSNVHGHSTRDSEVSPQSASYPVVIMRAGASAGVVGYSTLAEDLASHGYVVVGFDAPYRTNVVAFPDGRVLRRTPENNPETCAAKAQAEQAGCMSALLKAWTADVAFVLDRLERLNSFDKSGRFTGRLEMARVGIFGHSFGGATAAQFCHDDSRCKAAIDLDGQPFGSVVQAGLRQPFMFVLSDHQTQSPDPETRQILANIQSIFDRLPVDSRQRIVIRGANHFLFSDDGALLKSRIVLRFLRMFGVVGIEGRRQLAVTTYVVHSFFDRHLKGAGAASLNLSSPLYPEIHSFE